MLFSENILTLTESFNKNHYFPFCKKNSLCHLVCNGSKPANGLLVSKHYIEKKQRSVLLCPTICVTLCQWNVPTKISSSTLICIKFKMFMSLASMIAYTNKNSSVWHNLPLLEKVVSCWFSGWENEGMHTNVGEALTTLIAHMWKKDSFFSTQVADFHNVC